MSSYNYFTMRMISSEENLKTISLRIISDLDNKNSIVRPNPERETSPFWCSVENIRICKTEDDTCVLYLDYSSVNSCFDFEDYVENELNIKDVYFCLSCVCDCYSNREIVLNDKENKFYKKTFFPCEDLIEFLSSKEKDKLDEDYEEFCKEYEKTHVSKEQFESIYRNKYFTVSNYDEDKYTKEYCYTSLYSLKYDEEKVICDYSFSSPLHSFKDYK